MDHAQGMQKLFGSNRPAPSRAKLQFLSMSSSQMAEKLTNSFAFGVPTKAAPLTLERVGAPQTSRRSSTPITR